MRVTLWEAARRLPLGFWIVSVVMIACSIVVFALGEPLAGYASALISALANRLGAAGVGAVSVGVVVGVVQMVVAFAFALVGWMAAQAGLTRWADSKLVDLVSVVAMLATASLIGGLPGGDALHGAARHAAGITQVVCLLVAFVLVVALVWVARTRQPSSVEAGNEREPFDAA